MLYFPCSVHKKNNKSFKIVNIQFFLHIFVMNIYFSLIYFQTCGRITLYIWLFLSSLAYVGILTFSCYMGLPFLYGDYYSYDGEGLLKLFFAFLIICALLFSISNMYTICLVSKFGFCFVAGMEAEINNGLQNNGAQALQVNVCNYVL